MPMYEFSLGDNNGMFEFDSDGEIIEFLNVQINHYAWLRSMMSGPAKEIAIEIMNSIAHTQNVIAQGSTQYNWQDIIRHQVNGIFGDDKLPIYGTNLNQFVEQIRSKNGDLYALGALSFYANKIGHTLASKVAFAGASAAANRANGIGKSTNVAAVRSFDSLSSEVLYLLERLKSDMRDQDLAFRERALIYNKRNLVLQKWLDRRFRRFSNEWRSRGDIAEQGFKSMQATYEELLALKAPVDYWKDKAKSHRVEAARYRDLLIAWGWKIGLGVLISLSVIVGVSFLFAQADKPATAYLTLVTIGVVITTMAFWAARLVVRLYMSEHHLAIDADERAVMALTYLALIEKGAVEEKDRALILAPLFRPSSDGIVKDDAAPDMSPAGLLSKALSK